MLGIPDAASPPAPNRAAGVRGKLACGVDPPCAT
jgi:hypothetical protein